MYFAAAAGIGMAIAGPPGAMVGCIVWGIGRLIYAIAMARPKAQ